MLNAIFLTVATLGFGSPVPREDAPLLGVMPDSGSAMYTAVRGKGILEDSIEPDLLLQVNMLRGSQNAIEKFGLGIMDRGGFDWPASSTSHFPDNVRSFPLRYHFGYGYLWYVAVVSVADDWRLVRIPIRELDYYRVRSQMRPLAAEPPAAAWGPITPATEAPEGGAADLGRSFEIVARRMSPIWGKYYQFHHDERNPVGFDFYPTSAHSCIFFVAMPPCGESKRKSKANMFPQFDRDSMLVYEYRFHAVSDMPNQPSPTWSGLWTRKRITDSLFTGPFRVFPDQDSDRFVTWEGAIFELPNAADMTQVKMRSCWSDPSQPIQVILDYQGPDACTYAFTAKSMFPLDAPDKARPTTVLRDNELRPNDPVPLLLKCEEVWDKRTTDGAAAPKGKAAK